MEKKVPINDIYPLIGRTIKDTYNDLNELLGERNPFASISIGTGFLVWKDTRRNWQQMIAASDIEQEAIRATKYELKKELIPVLGEDNAEKLFTTPDDSYIYYDYDGEDIKILITGWGFEKPVRHNVKPDIEDITIPNPVSVSFILDGQRLANYSFGIQLPKQVKRLCTSSDGIYPFTNLKVGSQCTLIDPQSGRRFILKVVEGQSHYDFDITSYSQLTVRVVRDGAPSVGETVDVAYNNNSYQLITDSNGETTLTLPYIANNSITATIKEQTKSELINERGNDITFVFESEKSATQTDIEAIVMCNNTPQSNKKVTIKYGNDIIEGVTNEYGIFSHHTTITPDEYCTVSVEGYEPQQRKLEEKATNIFAFNKEADEEYHLLIQNREGEACGGYPVYVEQNGMRSSYTSDENGVIVLPKMAEGTQFIVTDGNNSENANSYRLNKDEHEYIFVVDQEGEIRDIKLTILDYYQRPMKCRAVSLKQEDTGAEIEKVLNEEGSTYFPEDTFAKYCDIATNIIGSEREFKPIVFTTEEDEYEYILQEEKPKLLWRTVLLQIAILLALIAILAVVWYLFEPLSRGLYDLIYN